MATTTQKVAKSKTDKATVKKATKGQIEELSKKVKSKKEQSDAASTEAVVKKITEKKDLKYKYPKEVDSLDERKKFRHTVRRKINAFLKELKLVKAGKREGDFEKIEKEFNAFKNQVLANPESVKLKTKKED
jgi:hypothetical protein